MISGNLNHKIPLQVTCLYFENILFETHRRNCFCFVFSFFSFFFFIFFYIVNVPYSKPDKSIFVFSRPVTGKSIRPAFLSQLFYARSQANICSELHNHQLHQLIPLLTITSWGSLAAQEAVKKHGLQLKAELSANRGRTAFSALKRDISLGKRSVLVLPETASPSAVPKSTEYSDRIPAGPIKLRHRGSRFVTIQ